LCDAVTSVDLEILCSEVEEYRAHIAAVICINYSSATADHVLNGQTTGKGGVLECQIFITWQCGKAHSVSVPYSPPRRYPGISPFRTGNAQVSCNYGTATGRHCYFFGTGQIITCSEVRSARGHGCKFAEQFDLETFWTVVGGMCRCPILHHPFTFEVLI
jgi:hypothetical protein